MNTWKPPKNIPKRGTTIASWGGITLAADAKRLLAYLDKVQRTTKSKRKHRKKVAAQQNELRGNESEMVGADETPAEGGDE